MLKTYFGVAMVFPDWWNIYLMESLAVDLDEIIVIKVLYESALCTWPVSPIRDESFQEIP